LTEGLEKIVAVPVSVKKCHAAITLDALKGREGSTWKSTDSSKKVIERFRFNSKTENGEIKFLGSVTGRNKFHLENGQLVNSTDKSKSGFLTSEGNIKWSYNYTSSLEGANICPCKLSLERVASKKGRTWKTSDEERKTTETIQFSKITNGKVGFEGTVSKRRICEMQGEKLVSKYNRNIFAVLDGEGNLKWSDGFTSEVEDLCGEILAVGEDNVVKSLVEKILTA